MVKLQINSLDDKDKVERARFGGFWIALKKRIFVKFLHFFLAEKTNFEYFSASPSSTIQFLRARPKMTISNSNWESQEGFALLHSPCRVYPTLALRLKEMILLRNLHSSLRFQIGANFDDVSLDFLPISYIFLSKGGGSCQKRTVNS